MTDQQRKFFTELLEDENYPGAVEYLKEIDIDRAERAAYMGKIAQTLVAALDRARSKSARERVVYLRSLLAWVLKDFPGLAPLYREQLRGGNSGPDVLGDLGRGVRNINDVVNGRKSMQEGMEDAAEPLENFADQAGEALRDGLNQIGSFFENLGREMDGGRQSNSSDRESDRASSTQRDDATGKSHSEPDEDEPESVSVNITVENADDPLPHDIHDAER